MEALEAQMSPLSTEAEEAKTLETVARQPVKTQQTENIYCVLY
jgi:hypothetical protein